MTTLRRAPRILFVDQTAQLGGAELSLLDVVRRLPAQSTVLLFERGPFKQELEAAGIPVVVEPVAARIRGVARSGAGGDALRAIPALVRLIIAVARRARSSDLLYANTQKAFVVSALAGLLARKPVVWHLRDLLTAEHFSQVNRTTVVLLANACADRIIANSEATAQAFVEAGGRSDRVRVVYNGIDAAPFAALREEEVAARREELGLLGVPVVGVFSRLSAWKGQHVLIEALAQLPDVHAVLVGSALFGEADYEAELRDLADRRGVASRVHFLGFRRDIAMLMGCCDVIAHTSVSPEPFGRVIVEAMLAGRPVVATRGGGALEIIKNGETGLLVNPGDTSALEEAIRVLLEEPPLARRLSEVAADRARYAFTPSAMAKGVARVVEELRNGPS